DIRCIAIREIPEIDQKQCACTIRAEREFEAFGQGDGVSMEGFITGGESGTTGTSRAPCFADEVVEELTVEPQIVAVDNRLACHMDQILAAFERAAKLDIRAVGVQDQVFLMQLERCQPDGELAGWFIKWRHMPFIFDN